MKCHIKSILFFCMITGSHAIQSGVGPSINSAGDFNSRESEDSSVSSDSDGELIDYNSPYDESATNHSHFVKPDSEQIPWPEPRCFRSIAELLLNKPKKEVIYPKHALFEDAKSRQTAYKLITYLEEQRVTSYTLKDLQKNPERIKKMSEEGQHVAWAILQLFPQPLERNKETMQRVLSAPPARYPSVTVFKR